MFMAELQDIALQPLLHAELPVLHAKPVLHVLYVLYVRLIAAGLIVHTVSRPWGQPDGAAPHKR
jgi:hypothetical protein